MKSSSKRGSRPWLWAWPLVLSSLCVVACLESAWARPGGGESFSGGSRPSGGGGGGGGDELGLIIELVILCIRYPALGGVVLVGFVGYVLVQRARGTHLPGWTAGVPSAQVAPARRHFVARAALDRLRSHDPNFSVVLLEDFLFTLYAQLHSHRPGRGLKRLSAYVDAPVRQALQDPELQQSNGVLIGRLRYLGLTTAADHIRLDIEVESNLTETRNNKTRRLFLLERLVLQRAVTARSRPAERAHVLDCPNCGAALEAVVGEVCSYCREHVGGGRFDWVIRAVHCVRAEVQPPLLTANVEERGNDLPSVVAPGASQRLEAIRQHDPSFDFAALQERVQIIFTELQAGWSQLDQKRIRPYVSDNLFQYFGYWFTVYGEARCRNVTENARISRLELSDVLSDATYDAVTLRVYATGLDYTVSESGKLLKGSRTQERPYTEYWTVIRGRAAKGSKTSSGCPNCGAPLSINMAGQCEYCRAKVVSGQFDWVLSRIEQDDTYDG